jgi:Fe-S cluster assembly protein SufD
MDNARADVLAARDRLATQGWIRPKAESFRHLPPPGAQAWLGEEAEAQVPGTGAGWMLSKLPGGGVDARRLDAADAAQRAELFAGLTLPDAGDAAPFAWAHRALCRHGLRVRVAGQTVCLQLQRTPQTAVEAPLLVVDIADGAQCVLVEVHERDAGASAHTVTQNLQVHLNLGEGACVRHVRVVTPGPEDRWAHVVQARLGRAAHYEQVLMASGSGYHLQRTELDLDAAQASARIGSVLFAAGTALEQQVQAAHQAQDTRSAVESLVLASGSARAVVNAQTHIAPGASQAEARQRLSGVPTGGRPSLVLRPHLEIHHDQVQAAHGATWGALPEDALFYARQRGLDETQARALIIDGMARAVFDRALGDAAVVSALGLEERLAHGVARHLSQGDRHG